jgi:hypothetical protein
MVGVVFFIPALIAACIGAALLQLYKLYAKLLALLSKDKVVAGSPP